jgi:hypothetical protein
MLKTLVGPANTGLDPVGRAAPAHPCGAAVDGAGNLVFADTGNNVVRVAAARTGTFYGVKMRAGQVYIVAGRVSAHGTPATQAVLRGVAIAADGNVVVSDSGNQRIRLVAAANGRFYGQAMMSGDICTIAGNGSAGFAGDKGPAVRAELRSPAGVAIDGEGNVIFADAVNNRLRLVAARSGLFYGQQMTVGPSTRSQGTGSPPFPGTAASLPGRSSTRSAMWSPMASGETRPTPPTWRSATQATSLSRTPSTTGCG